MEFWGATNSNTETYTSEEADFMAQLLISSHEESLSLTSSELMVLEASSYHCSHTLNNATNVLHQGSNYSIDSCFGGAKTSNCNAIPGGDEECRFSPENPQKRALESPEVIVKRKGNVRGRKNQKLASPRGSEGDGEMRCNVQSSSSCSDDEPLPALKSNGKLRAGRGSATDPQSIYARKRRERINERLRILQKLVPNGTKVDISTMLAEAVQYIKFLQLQVKLLSSDDMWMYAPIAYNGINLGLDI